MSVYEQDLPQTEITSSTRTRSGVVLAAGNGDRFRGGGRSKLLHWLGGEPILARTLRCAREAGIVSATVVVGYQAEAVSAAARRFAPAGMQLTFAHNSDWHLENGVSVLAARTHAGVGHFALLMGDHVFDPVVLRRLLRLPLEPDESALAVDTRETRPEIVAEATKVRRDGARITAIGKDLDAFDALDTGMFVCAPNLFPALERSREAGDTTLSGGIRQLAARGLMRAVEIRDAQWCDIDTAHDLEAAESAIARLPASRSV